MDDSKRSSVIKFAGLLDTQPLDPDVSTLPGKNQTSLASVMSASSPSLSNEFAKQNTKGRSTVGAEFQVEKEDGSMECGLCRKVYAAKNSLKFHMNRHYGIKPYRCSFCPKGFARTSELKVHKAYHTGRRDWVCNICKRAYTKSSHLRRHMKTHSDQKDTSDLIASAVSARKCSYRYRRLYVYLLCDNCFTRSEPLLNHENSVHHGFRPYICSETGCSITSTRQSALRRHVRSMHTTPKT